MPQQTRLLARFQAEPERWQLDRFFEALTDHSENPEVWAGILVGCLDGISLEQGKACTTAQLAAACAAYRQVVGDGKWGDRHFRATVESFMRGPLRVPTSQRQDDDPFRAVTEELAAQERKESAA